MQTKLTNTICYRLGSELKTKLLDKLNREQISLSSFHRDVIKAELSSHRLTETVLEPIKGDTVC